MSIQTRPAVVTDAERIVALYGEFTGYLRKLGDNTDYRLTPDIYRRDGFGPNPAFFGLVAELGSEVIGYLLYHFGYDAELAARVMFIIDLYVAEEHRMQKAGTSLMAHAQSICRESQATEILWSVYKPNRTAHDFYKRLGAELIDDLDYMYLKVGGQNAK